MSVGEWSVTQDSRLHVVLDSLQSLLKGYAVEEAEMVLEIVKELVAGRREREQRKQEDMDEEMADADTGERSSISTVHVQRTSILLLYIAFRILIVCIVCYFAYLLVYDMYGCTYACMHVCRCVAASAMSRDR